MLPPGVEAIVPDGLEALARAKVFRERADEYRSRGRDAANVAARESYLQLEITYTRLARDMEVVARAKRFSVTTEAPVPAAE